MEAQVWSHACACGICGGWSGTGTGFCLEYFVFPCVYHFTDFLYMFNNFVVHFSCVLEFYQVANSTTYTFLNHKGIYYLMSPTCFSLLGLVQGYHLTLQEGHEDSCRYDYSVRIKRNNNVIFKVCKSVHHRTIQINHQPDATIFQFIILTFIYSSTCFGHSPMHHQELNDCNSSGQARPAQPRTQHGYHHDTKVKPEAATAVVELLMMNGRMSETCWAVNKRQDNKLENCCIWLVIYLN